MNSVEPTGRRFNQRWAEEMKQFAQDFLRAVATFGIVSSLTAAAYIAIMRTPVTSDDPYIIGVLIGTVVSLSLLVSLVCESVWKKKVAMFVYAGIYLALLLYAVRIVMNAELHGPGLAIVILGSSVLWAIVEFALFRRVRLLYFGSIGSVLAVVVIGGFIAVQR